MADSERWQITYAENGQNGGEVTVNQLAQRLEVVAQIAVKSIGDTSPPGSPANGDAYILGSTPTGDWSAFAEHDIAFYYDGWYAATPGTNVEGARAYVQDTDEDYLWDGSAWQAQYGGMTNKLPVRSVTTTDSTTTADRILTLDGTNTYALTLVGAANFTGRMQFFIKTGASGIVTITGAGGNTIDGAGTVPMAAQYDRLAIFSDGSNWYKVGTNV